MLSKQGVAWVVIITVMAVLLISGAIVYENKSGKFIKDADGIYRVPGSRVVIQTTGNLINERFMKLNDNTKVMAGVFDNGGGVYVISVPKDQTRLISKMLVALGSKKFEIVNDNLGIILGQYPETETIFVGKIYADLSNANEDIKMVFVAHYPLDEQTIFSGPDKEVVLLKILSKINFIGQQE